MKRRRKYEKKPRSTSYIMKNLINEKEKI